VLNQNNFTLHQMLCRWSSQRGWNGRYTHGRDEKCLQYFGWETWKEKDHLEDAGVDGRMILEW